MDTFIQTLNPSIFMKAAQMGKAEHYHLLQQNFQGL